MPPNRYKDPADYTPDEHLGQLRASKQGKGFKVETDEYKQARADHLRAGGFEDEADEADEADKADPADPENMSVDDHYKQVRSGRL